MKRMPDGLDPNPFPKASRTLPLLVEERFLHRKQQHRKHPSVTIHLHHPHHHLQQHRNNDRHGPERYVAVVTMHHRANRLKNQQHPPNPPNRHPPNQHPNREQRADPYAASPPPKLLHPLPQLLPRQMRHLKKRHPTQQHPHSPHDDPDGQPPRPPPSRRQQRRPTTSCPLPTTKSTALAKACLCKWTESIIRALSRMWDMGATMTTMIATTMRMVGEEQERFRTRWNSAMERFGMWIRRICLRMRMMIDIMILDDCNIYI
mmetsp:Transcript_36144/g.76154  ORF Transcript_36144/g.76154 Transcript_36144/m.76154 type:complete len:261 (+) Transcript_36144:1294-2076(+)